MTDQQKQQALEEIEYRKQLAADKAAKLTKKCNTRKIINTRRYTTQTN